MTRYLDLAYIQSALNRDKAVAQWLPPKKAGDRTILRALTIEPSRDLGAPGVRLRYCERFDTPEMGTYDFGEFPPVDWDEPEGVVEHHSSLEQAMEAARIRYGAQSDRYLHESVIDTEYAAYRTALS